MKRIVFISYIVLVTALFSDGICAQEKSFGATFSYAGTGFDYMRYIDSRHFAQYQIRMESASLLWAGHGKAGVSASAFWNSVFAQIESRNGNTVRFYAGPGISLGYSEDFTYRSGLIFGLKGNIGAECHFARGVDISLSIAPMLGGHFRRKEGMVNMRLYRSGIYYALMPEIGIRYNF
jgi:hypothetical protein